jgi:hypothetical protein
MLIMPRINMILIGMGIATTILHRYIGSRINFINATLFLVIIFIAKGDRNKIYIFVFIIKKQWEEKRWTKLLLCSQSMLKV